jgi:hypothetical protein
LQQDFIPTYEPGLEVIDKESDEIYCRYYEAVEHGRISVYSRRMTVIRQICSPVGGVAEISKGALTGKNSHCESWRLKFCDALSRAGALTIVTEWKQFRSYDFDARRRQLQDKVIFDGRNMSGQG